jgi:MoaA/NifB/PqqE/SkfB family radical SAM enzyme
LRGHAPAREFGELRIRVSDMLSPDGLQPHKGEAGSTQRGPVEMQRSATLTDYDVECDWYLLSTCNYRCSYCFLAPEDLGAKLRKYATAEQWESAFNATGRSWLIHVTGGEPTVYPDFVEICELLTRNHVISINSNLSRSVVRTMAERVDPYRVSFINAGLHVVERLRHRGARDFFSNARYLQDAGFRVIVTVVATPEVVANLSRAVAECAAWGLRLAPKVLRGAYGGKHYPRDYEPHERARLRGAVAQARDYYRAKFAAWPPPSIDVFSDDELLEGLPDFRDLACSAGFRFVSISPNGDVHRCGGDGPEMGNLLDGTFRLASTPHPCDRKYCVYFCKKYTADAARFPVREVSPGLAVSL